MRAGKERKRMALAADAEHRPGVDIPALRRLVIIIDYDLGQRVNVFELRRTDRIDSYRVAHNGEPLAGRVGWSNFCKRLSVFFPRLMSASAVQQQCKESAQC
jgi:hypothetical protein